MSVFRAPGSHLGTYLSIQHVHIWTLVLSSQAGPAITADVSISVDANYFLPAIQAFEVTLASSVSGTYASTWPCLSVLHLILCHPHLPLWAPDSQGSLGVSQSKTFVPTVVSTLNTRSSAGVHLFAPLFLLSLYSHVTLSVNDSLTYIHLILDAMGTIIITEIMYIEVKTFIQIISFPIK